MLKIGLLTYCGTLNTGTTLQAYSTYKALKNNFPEDHLELIDYLPWRSINRPYLMNCTIQSLINDLIRIRKYKKFLHANFTLSKNKLRSPNYEESLDFIKSLNYDVIFVGADTVLELDRANKESLTAYWLSKSLKCKKFLIAASAKNVTFENMSERQKYLAKDTIEDFSLLGVRDEATYRLLSHFTLENDNRLINIPDPTFTLDPKIDYAEEYLRNKKLSFEMPTICFHLQRNIIWAEELAKEFRKKGFQIASFRPGKYADVLLNDLSPLEQFGIYKYFKLVITNRFHDTIFCLLNKTPVITYQFNERYTTQFGESKYASLLKYFNLGKSNYLEDTGDISAKRILSMYQNAINSFYDNVENIEDKISESKKIYLDYINKAKLIIYE
jgi:polysaccharide pyruvyl transferase WcaK-like protein